MNTNLIVDFSNNIAIWIGDGHGDVMVATAGSTEVDATPITTYLDSIRNIITTTINNGGILCSTYIMNVITAIKRP